MRAQRLTVAPCALLLALLTCGPAWATEPTTCNFPALADNFDAVQTMSKWTADHHNRLLCAVNRLEDRTLTSGTQATVCTDVTVAAATRQVVSLGFGGAIGTQQPLFPSVIDATTPARLIPDGIVRDQSGTTVSAYVFNRDADNARQGRLCVSLVQP